MPNLDEPTPPPPAPARGIAERRAGSTHPAPAPAPAQADTDAETAAEMRAIGLAVRKRAAMRNEESAGGWGAWTLRDTLIAVQGGAFEQADSKSSSQPEGEAPAPPREAVAPRAPAQCHGGCLLQAILDENWKLCAALIEADEDGQQCAPGHLDRRRHWNAIHFFASKGEVFLTGLALDRASCVPVSLAEPPKSPPSPCRASGGAPRLCEARRGSALAGSCSGWERFACVLGWGLEPRAAHEQVPAALRQSLAGVPSLLIGSLACFCASSLLPRSLQRPRPSARSGWSTAAL